eukprot:scaffold3878_cov363-Prasinococcus_capsulatus_cf.AAC.9
MDAREGAHDDSHAAHVSRLQRGMLARGALAVVLVAHHHPLDARVTVLPGNHRHLVGHACDLVGDGVGLARLCIDSADEHVV